MDNAVGLYHAFGTPPDNGTGRLIDELAELAE
jgi:hypothetical protein